MVFSNTQQSVDTSEAKAGIEELRNRATENIYHDSQKRNASISGEWHEHPPSYYYLEQLDLVGSRCELTNLLKLPKPS
eukprot:5974340-Prymnesium_polylepis.1